MYNGADKSLSEGADRDPNGGGFNGGEEGGQDDEISDEEDAGSEEGQDDCENEVKVEEVWDGCGMGQKIRNMKGLCRCCQTRSYRHKR